LISVSDIAIEYEGQTGEFKYFEMKRGSREEEDAERWGFINSLLKNLVTTFSTMNKNRGEN